MVVSHKQCTGMQRQTTSTWEISIILKKRSATLQYLDANNLYGWAMNQPLPIRVVLSERKEVERFTPKKIANLVKNGRKGYLLEVDVEYPDKASQDTHNDLPFMPEKMKINKVEN